MEMNVTDWSQQYLSSMYWSLTTLMKTPWIGPDTVLEKLFSCVCVVLGATLFATLLGNVTALVSSYDKRHAELRDRLTTLHNFAAFRRVPLFLQRKMLRYVDAHWNMTAGLDHNEILQSLPAQMRGSSESCHSTHEFRPSLTLPPAIFLHRPRFELYFRSPYTEPVLRETFPEGHAPAPLCGCDVGASP